MVDKAVSDNLYNTPSSDLKSDDENVFAPVKRPWPIFVIAVWMLLCFMLLSSNIKIILSSLLEETSKAGSTVGTVFLLLGLVLIVGVVKLHKWSVYIAGAFCILLGVLELYQVFWALTQSEDLIRFALVVLILYTIPSLLSAWYMLRPEFRGLVERNRKYKQMVSMNKYVAKKLGK